MFQNYIYTFDPDLKQDLVLIFQTKAVCSKVIKIICSKKVSLDSIKTSDVHGSVFLSLLQKRYPLKCICLQDVCQARDQGQKEMVKLIKKYESLLNEHKEMKLKLEVKIFTYFGNNLRRTLRENFEITRERGRAIFRFCQIFVFPTKSTMENNVGHFILLNFAILVCNLGYGSFQEKIQIFNI